MTSRWKSRIGLAALTLLVLVSVLYPLLAPPPSASPTTWCPFGKAPGSSTANVCDRTVSGMWISIAVGVLSSGIACGVGLALALAARRFGRVVDEAISRAADLFFAVPDVLVLIGIHIAARQVEVTRGTSLSPFWMMVISLAVIGWAAPARMIRNRLHSLESQEFVAAAYAIGETRWQVLVRELLPFAREYVLAIFLLRVPATILAESTVSFLGLGMPDSQPSLGSFLGRNPQQMLAAPQVIVPAWILLVVIVVAFQWTGQGLIARAEADA